jgi:hypothetical protein
MPCILAAVRGFGCLVLPVALGMIPGCSQAEFVDSSRLGGTSFLVVVDARDQANRIVDPPSLDGSIVTRLAAGERLVAVNVDDAELDRLLPGIERGSGAPIRLVIEAPPSEAVPPFPALEILSVALPEGTEFLRAQDGRFEVVSEFDDLAVVLRAQLTLRVSWDPEFCRDPDAAAVRPFFEGQFPEAYEAKPILWLDDRFVMVGLADSPTIRGFAKFLYAAILQEGEVVEESTKEDFCAEHTCLDGKESFFSWAPLSNTAFGRTHVERLGSFVTYDDPDGVRWVVMVRVAVGDLLTGENNPSVSYLDFFQYQDGSLTWIKTVGGFEGPSFGSLDIEAAGRIVVGVARSASDAGTEEIWVFERFLDNTFRILPPPVRLDGSSPIKWSDDPAASLLVGAERFPAVLLGLDQRDCVDDGCWSSWRSIELQDGRLAPSIFRDFDVEPGAQPGVWLGGDGSNLFRYGAGDVSLVRRRPAPPPRFVACVAEDGSLGDIRALAVGEEYLQLGVNGCAFLVQIRKTDQCVSLVNPDLRLFPSATLPDRQGVRAIDVRNSRVVFGGLGSRLFVFP